MSARSFDGEPPRRVIGLWGPVSKGERIEGGEDIAEHVSGERKKRISFHGRRVHSKEVNSLSNNKRRSTSVRS